MDPDFSAHHHHLYHHHLGFGGLADGSEWPPLLAGLLATVVLAWVLLLLLGRDQFAPVSRPSGRGRTSAAVRARWHDAMGSHAAITRQFVAYECDPGAVLQHPDLADITRPATALFIEAFAEANALATEKYPGREHATRFAQAAQRAQEAWQAAVHAACHNGNTSITPDQRIQQPRHRLGEPEERTDWIPTTPGRHRTRAAGPRHAALG